MMSVFCYVLAAVANVLWLCMRDRLSMGQQMFVPIITVGLIGVGTLFSCVGMPKEGQKRRMRRCLWSILLYYLAILSVLLFFGGLFYLDRVWGGPVNLKPFYTIRNFFVHYRRTGSLSSLFNLLGNIAILVPLGVLLPVMFRSMRRFWIFLPLVAGIAVGIEYLQWCTATGIADVDDSILNFIGAAAGYFVTRLCQLIYHLIRKKTKLK